MQVIQQVRDGRRDVRCGVWTHALVWRCSPAAACRVMLVCRVAAILHALAKMVVAWSWGSSEAGTYMLWLRRMQYLGFERGRNLHALAKKDAIWS